MRATMALVAGVMVGLGVAVGGARQSDVMADDATAQAVRAVKRGIVEGHRTKNRAALEALYATDYTAIDARGAVRRKADLLNGLAADPDMVEGRYDLGAIRRWGSVAVAAGHGRMIYRNADGSTRVSEYDSVNVFEERHGKWWYVAAYLP